jgi:hypothetical protein
MVHLVLPIRADGAARPGCLIAANVCVIGTGAASRTYVPQTSVVMRLARDSRHNGLAWARTGDEHRDLRDDD